MNKQKPLIVLMGAAGSGKGTQAELLVEKLGYEHIEAGALVRAKSQENSDLGRQFKAISDSGGHAPDEMITALIAERFNKTTLDKPLVVDGFPRTLGQAELFGKMLEETRRDKGPLAVVWINVGLEEAKRRLLNRSVCTVCRTSYDNRKISVCTKCGGKVVPRADDNPEGIAKRLGFFVHDVMSVIELYRSQGVLHEINGEQDPEHVFADLTKAVGLTGDEE